MDPKKRECGVPWILGEEHGQNLQAVIVVARNSLREGG